MTLIYDTEVLTMTQEVKLRRVHCNYQPENARFLLDCDFSKQYNQYYRKRLEKTRPYVEYNCRQRWNPSIPIHNLSEVAGGMECIVIGTIFKRMKLQPDVVSELSKGDFNVKVERYLGHYTSQDDTLVLEDNEESIQLIGNINPKRFVTGVIVALLGASIDNGSRFMVIDVCFAEPDRELLYDKSVTSSPEKPLATQQPCFLMIVSGLGFNHEMSKKSSLTRALQDLIDFIWGGAKFEFDSRGSRVARILVAGDSLHENRLLVNDDELCSQVMENSRDEIMMKMKRSRQVKQYSESVEATKHMDGFFAELSKTINVDVMPGPADPSSHLLPQQPFHPCMFPKSCMFSTFNCTTNPHHAIYDDTVELLATAGQNVDIISKFSEISDPIEVMKCHLKWGSSAPNAPDNLYSVPYEDDDPYVMDFIPDIYVAGGQAEFKTDYYNYRSDEQSGNSSQYQHSTPTSSRKYYDLDNKLNATPGSNASLRSLDSAATSPRPVGFRRSYVERDVPITPQIDDELVEQLPEAASRSSPSVSRNLNARKSRTLLVTVPRFCETFSCVLVDLKTLDAQLLSFKS